MSTWGRGIIVGLIAWTALLCGAAPARAATQPAAVVDLVGPIDDYTARVFRSNIDAAIAGGAEVVIVRLSTPGGAVLPALETSAYLRNLRVHTVAYVDRTAYSAGAMLAAACDEIVMTPGAFIGDCAPIVVAPEGGLQTLGQAERAKAESPIQADFLASARRNGHDPLLLSAMVSYATVVRVLEGPDGVRRVVEADGAGSLIAAGWKPATGVPDPLDRADTLLTVDDVTAREIGLSKGSYASVDALAAERGYAIAKRYVMSGGERVVEFLASPAVRGVLLSVFMLTLYVSFNVPGHGWPEAVCLTALGLALGVPALTGYATWYEILAVVVGVALLAAEVFVIPGFGVAGVAGLVLVVGGLLGTFVAGEPAGLGWTWKLPATWESLQRGLVVLAATLAVSGGGAVGLARWLPKLPFGRKLVLAEATPAAKYRATWPAVGAAAVASTDLLPGGMVELPDPDAAGVKAVAVVSDSGFIAWGSTVRVVRVEGATVTVRLADGGAA